MRSSCAGQAGPFLAAQLTGAGQTVALIERKLVGGTCVNYGCIPTKRSWQAPILHDTFHERGDRPSPQLWLSQHARAGGIAAVAAVGAATAITCVDPRSVHPSIAV